MDLVTRNLLDTFRESEQFPSDMEKSTLFEHFANYCVVASEYTEEFDLEDLSVGGGNDLQLDGIALIVNGALVTTVEEVDDLLSVNRYIDAEFIFVQAKSSTKFDGAEISNVFFGIRDLFDDKPKLPRNQEVKEKEKVIKHIYQKSAYFRRGNPRVKIFYVTTGKWHEDWTLKQRINGEIETIEDLNIFESPPQFIPVDARQLQKLHARTQSVYTKTVAFTKRITLPAVQGVREAYLGYIPVDEYLSAITDDDGTLLRGLFYENVRDFQGDNPVNKEIESTLHTDCGKSLVLLNNGVTVVADELNVTGDNFTITGLQVVNGCQTSHVLFNNWGVLDKDACVPVKLIVAPDDEVKTEVIKATNQQTMVKSEDLSALTDFQKQLERYYAATPETHRLYYERRSQQYRASNLEKIRIVSISTQIRAFASMFLGRAHQASRYYGTLLKEVEDKIFLEEHPPLAYYVSAYALFRFEAFLRKKEINNKYRPFKYHVLSVFRGLAAGLDAPRMSSNQFERYCEKIKDVLWDDEQCLSHMRSACAHLDAEVGGVFERDRAKDTQLHQKLVDRIRYQ